MSDTDMNVENTRRMGRADTFHFACKKGLPCFNKCCADINIVLTPYDIVRLKNRLNISSGEFLTKYGIVPFSKQQRIPVVILKMAENEAKSCQFVSEEGCTVYADRPWACRMYPVGLAASKQGDSGRNEEFFFLMEEEACLGLKEKREITVADWMGEQGVEDYTELGELFQKITMHPALLSGKDLEPPQMEMMFMVCYDLDKFRRFVFESTFLESFEVDPATLKKIKKNDVELLKFGFQWLLFSLFKQKTMKLKDSVLKARGKQLHSAKAK